MINSTKIFSSIHDCLFTLVSFFTNLLFCLLPNIYAAITNNILVNKLLQAAGMSADDVRG